MTASANPLRKVFDEAFATIDMGREAFSARLAPHEIGAVTNIAVGIAKVSGLLGAGSEELLSFPGGVFGIAFNIDEDEIGVVLLGDHDKLSAGDEVRRTGRVMDVIVGDALIGRVIDPLGRPLDGGGAIAGTERLPIERPATAIMDRAPVTVPLQTGLKVIDAMIPIGRGQRELILGDRRTGKTAIAIDTVLNQRGKDVHLCLLRHWPAGVGGRQGRRRSARQSSARIHRRRRRRRQPAPGAALHRALRSHQHR